MKVANAFDCCIIFLRQLSDDHPSQGSLFPILVGVPLVFRAHIHKVLALFLKGIELILHVATWRKSEACLWARHALQIVLHPLLKNFGFTSTKTLKEKTSHSFHLHHPLLLNLPMCFSVAQFFKMTVELLSLSLPAINLPFHSPESFAIEQAFCLPAIFFTKHIVDF